MLTSETVQKLLDVLNDNEGMDLYMKAIVVSLALGAVISRLPPDERQNISEICRKTFDDALAFSSAEQDQANLH